LIFNLIKLTFLLLITILVIKACGDSSEVIEYKKEPPKKDDPNQPLPDPDPVDPTNPSPDKDAIKVAAIDAIKRNCTNCHNPAVQPPSLQQESDIIRQKSRICIRVSNGTMPPPPARLGNDDKKLIGDFVCN
jgi:hypothetical protein